MKFVVSGSVKLGRLQHSFNKTVEAQNENLAKEFVFSNFGGKYKVDRRKIKIESVKKAEEK